MELERAVTLVAEAPTFKRTVVGWNRSHGLEHLVWRQGSHDASGAQDVAPLYLLCGQCLWEG